MATPTLDGSVQALFSTVATKSVSLTTTQTNDIICVIISYELNAALRDVTSVTASGLTFVRRFKKTYTTSNMAIELWWAASTGALTGLSITATLDAAIDDGIMGAFGVHGVNSLTAPWDTNSGLAYVANNGGSGANPTVTYSTDQANDFLIGIGTTTSNADTIPPSGWTQIIRLNNNGGVNANSTFVNGKGVTSAQVSQTYNPNSGFAGAWLTIIDALTGDATFSTETGTGAMHFGGIGIGGTGHKTATAGGSMHFTGASFSAAGTAISVLGAGALHFGGIAISGHAFKVQVLAAGAMHFGGISILAAGILPGALSSLRQFSTFG